MINCVNTGHPDFIKLSKESGVSKENLEVIVHTYQNKLGTDYFPSPDYVTRQLTGDNYAESEAQLELWIREYSSDLIFSSKEDLDRAYQEAIKYFEKEAITTFINDKGYRVLRVAEPNKLKGNKILGTNLVLDDSLIEHFYNKVSSDSPYHQIYKQMVDTLRANNIPISIVEDNTLDKGVAARRQDGFKTATIRFNRIKLQELLMTYPKDHAEGNLFRILTHELVHALTAEILETHPSWSSIRGFDEAQTKFANEIDSLYNEAVEAIGHEDWYGLTNRKEFISEALTNRNFQKRLATLKSKKSSLWNRFVNSITKLFKSMFAGQDIDISNSILDEILSVSEEYFTYAYKGLNRGIDDYKGGTDSYISSRNQGLAILHKLKDVDNKVTDNTFKLIHQSWGNKSVFFYQVPKNSGLTNAELNERAYSLLEEKLKGSKATIADYKVGPELTTIYRNGKVIGYGFKIDPREFSSPKQKADTTVDESWNPYLEDAQARQDEIDKELEMLGRDDYSDGGEDTAFETSNEDPFLVESRELTRQINNLTKSTLMTSSEVRGVAEQIVYSISDHITDMIEHPDKAREIYGDIADIDWANATRLEVVNAIGADNLIAYAREIFTPRAGKYAKRSTNKKAKLITDNWKGIMRLAYDVFGSVEDFTLVKVDNNTQAVEQDNLSVDDFNNSNNKESIEENEGSLQEHWQVESRTLDIITSMSQLVKQSLAKCYVLVGTMDEQGNTTYERVPDEFGINKRVNTRDAVNSILRWTQGSLDLPMMIEALKRRVDKNPWVSQVIERLQDDSGKHTDFQSQFYSTFAKHFQTYDVVVLEDGKYVTKTVNVDPAMKQVITGIKALYSIGQHPLFNQSGVNKTELAKLKEAHTSLSVLFKDTNVLATEKIPEVANTIAYVSTALGFNILPEDVSKVIDTKKVKNMIKSLGYIVGTLEVNSDKVNYDPLEFGSEGIGGNLRSFLSPLVDAMEDTAVSSFYDSGKMYQSYITPSYMTILMNKFHNEEKINEFLQEEYGKYEWFKDQRQTDITRGWKNSWLRELARDKKARDIFAHKVQLNFNKSNYMRGMDDIEYTLSVLSEYFSETPSAKQPRVPAWFRIPMMSNKPSSEFIRFYSERGVNYKETIVNGLMNIFSQELGRIQFTRQHNYTSKDQEFIKNYDKNGKKFQFLDWMNEYLDGNKKDSELGKLIALHIEGKELDSTQEAKMKDLAKEAIFNFMDSRAKSIVAAYNNTGIAKAAAKINNIGKDETEIAQNLENFVWNDFYASQMILQLTITDTAYYKDAEDLQKRLAQIHAPGVRGNIMATDYNGKRVTDGISRNVVLTDFDKVVSNIKENVGIVFDKKITNAPEHLKAGYRAMKENILAQFDDLNVADAQAYSSPSSYRKKAFIFGKWSKQAEEVYNKLIDGNYTYDDLKVAFQPLKPFVYGQIEKQRGEGPMSRTKVGVQNKNSEYLLILADAILQNEDTGRPNLLRAIYEVMEESATEEIEEVINGKSVKRKSTKVNGIDTIQFESAVKAGLQNKVDLRKFLSMENGEAEAKAALRAAIYNADGSYNLNTVNEIPFEYYALQQEVPAHFKDHEQAHGSQERYIIPSDLETEYDGEQVFYTVEGRKLTAEQFKEEYERTIAENIEESIREVAEELHLVDSTRRERNTALSKILQREILSSPRYGVDLLQACSLDENGEFRIPLGDPIQSKRVEQLINSIVKNRVNKQTIAGGPVVQVSNFGTSRELNIRFKDKNGGLLKTKAEFVASYKETPSQTDKFNARYGRKTSTSSVDKAYQEYIRENQGGIAYMEVFAPIYTQDIFSKFMNEDGSIDMEAIEATNPDLLKMVGYRIPTEDKYSISPLKIVGFLPREAGDGIMLPNDITLLTGSDFDVDKEYLQRKEFNIKTRSRKELREILTEKLFASKAKQGGLKGRDKAFISEKIEMFLDNPEKMRYIDDLMRSLWYEYKRIAYIVEEPTEGRTYRNNKIIDMTYEVLTHASTADKVLNPGGFEEQKKMGYMVEARRKTGMDWSELQSKSTNELKDLCYTSKNLGFIDTHVQFYKQNAAAGTILGMFAVQKIAHAALEGDGYMVNIPDAIYTNEPFTIAGMTFEGNMTFDMKYSRDGQLIGKVLGSLVASAADAVKDPVLNLMNINSSTANILNGLIRLGMPFSDVALFLSQKTITDLLNEFAISNISDYKSLGEIIGKRISDLEKTHSIDNESTIHTEELTKEELVQGLTNPTPEIEYKTLVALQKVQAITNALKGPSFATRFNSMSSAVGPLVIDNLILEHKFTKFSDALRDKDGNSLTIIDIFRNHPILSQFSQTVAIAKNMLSDLPANSTTFRSALERVGDYLEDILYNDRKLLSSLSDFFQSYVMVASKSVNEEELSYYVNEFANDYMKQKYNTKEEYLNNPFIQAIKLEVDKRTNKPVLKIDTTGLDRQQKEALSNGWTDLHKVNPELSLQLVKYNFFRGGIGFNPKTFMALMPNYVKERIPNYLEAFRHLPDMVVDVMIDQFIRNNWSNNKLVPRKKPKYILKNNILEVYNETDIEAMKSIRYFKNRMGNEEVLWRLMGRGREGHLLYEKITPLGNNGEFVEMSTRILDNSVTLTTATTEESPESDVQPISNDTEPEVIPTKEEKDKATEKLLYDIIMNTRDKSAADAWVSKNTRRNDLAKGLSKYFTYRLESMGIKADEETINKLLGILDIC